MVLGSFFLLLIIIGPAALKFRWPIPNAVAALAVLALPIVVTAVAGALAAPTVPVWLRVVSRRLQTDEAALRVMTASDVGTLALHISRRFTMIYVALGLALTAVSVFLIVVVASSMGLPAGLAGWAGLLFFGTATLLFVIQSIRPNRFGLTLDAEGFVVTMNLGWRRYRWIDVDNFFPFYTVALYAVVVFKYRGRPEIHGIQMTWRPWGFDGSLPQNLSIRGLALLDLMESWRLRRVSSDK